MGADFGDIDGDGRFDQAGHEIDEKPRDATEAQTRALKLRHVIEQMGTEMLQRFARAYGPYPLAMNGKVSRRYQEANLYMRQSHAERDLEALGRCIQAKDRSKSLFTI